MNKLSIRNLILTCLLLSGIGLILTAARDNPPSQDVMIAIVSGEISEDAVAAGRLPTATPENDGFFRIVDAEDDEMDGDAGEENSAAKNGAAENKFFFFMDEDDE